MLLARFVNPPQGFAVVVGNGGGTSCSGTCFSSACGTGFAPIAGSCPYTFHGVCCSGSGSLGGGFKPNPTSPPAGGVGGAAGPPATNCAGVCASSVCGSGTTQVPGSCPNVFHGVCCVGGGNPPPTNNCAGTCSTQQCSSGMVPINGTCINYHSVCCAVPTPTPTPPDPLAELIVGLKDSQPPHAFNTPVTDCTKNGDICVNNDTLGGPNSDLCAGGRRTVSFSCDLPGFQTPYSCCRPFSGSGNGGNGNQCGGCAGQTCHLPGQYCEEPSAACTSGGKPGAWGIYICDGNNLPWHYLSYTQPTSQTCQSSCSNAPASPGTCNVGAGGDTCVPQNTCGSGNVDHGQQTCHNGFTCCQTTNFPISSKSPIKPSLQPITSWSITPQSVPITCNKNQKFCTYSTFTITNTSNGSLSFTINNPSTDISVNITQYTLTTGSNSQIFIGVTANYATVPVGPANYTLYLQFNNDKTLSDTVTVQVNTSLSQALLASKVLGTNTTTIPPIYVTVPTTLPISLTFFPTANSTSPQNKPYSVNGTITYNPANNTFGNANLQLSNVPSGSYTLYGHIGNYLDRQFTQPNGNIVFTLSPGQKIAPQIAEFTPGDLAPLLKGDNFIDLLDYNLIRNCLINLRSGCPNPGIADFNRDGIVDDNDLQILMSHYGELGDSPVKPHFVCVTDPTCAKTKSDSLQLCALKCTKQN